MSPVDPFDDASTARAVIDERGIVVRWGAGARRLLGYEAAEAVGRPAADFLADTDADTNTGAGTGTSALAAPAGPRWSGTLTLRHRDGRAVTVWLLALRRPTHDWQAVVPPAAADLDPPDDALTSAAMRQSPCPMLVCDQDLRLRWINERMTELIDLPAHPVDGLRITDIGVRRENTDLEEQLRDVLTTGRPRDIENYLRPSGLQNASAHLTRLAPLTDAAGHIQGVCLTGHDFTEHYLARERLRLVNEASLSIGTTLDVTRTAQELAQVCVPALADFVSIDLLDPQDGVEPPARFAPPLRLRRTAHHSVNPGTPEAVAQPGQAQEYPTGSPQADSLVAGRTIVRTVAGGELDAWLTWDTARAARVRELGIHSTMSVPIQARGVTLGVAVLTRFRRPDPFTPDDVLLAEEVTARAAVCVDNARRYSRERETALALQRSLLPRTLPRTAAVDAASRYLPAARAGVGGDWFDVIPLSGMRVAMVVGDVVGHGIQASATMGRLRTAVRTLADIDLAPDELLTHLDDLVLRLSEEAGVEGSPGEMGATCLYAVYDPVSRRCVMARAGHPPPLLLRAGGTPRLVQLPAGPPLGLGGLPFESAELELAEGSVLAFYTDGLIESRERDVDAGQLLLAEALAARSDSLDETCDRILHALLPPGGAGDDVALLLARTRGLPASQVATWDVPADPALVAPIRKQVVEQLSAWELSDASFTTELVVSELVTNAIRYGSRPIRLRLIHDAATLICEVSDDSHTAPHLRRAKTWDEGGRGLLLVAQLTQRWGSRHTPEGKTIWAELSLFDEE
ncbi:SpoIIE family protein phosphatase [Streptomyces sp. NPDC001858]